MKSSTIKKVFMCVICAVMVTVSALPIVGAQDAESSETGITKIFYRDYEDYTGGIGYMSVKSDNGKYGTATIPTALSGSFNNAAASAQGKNGKGVCFTKCTSTMQSSAVNLNFNTEITSGQLYTAFDMTVNPNATKNFIIKTLNTSDEPSGFFGVSGEATDNYEKFQLFRAANSNSWNGNKIDNVVLESGKTYKIEITANVSPDGTTYNYYIDGVLVGGPYVQNVTSVKGFTMETSNLLDYFDTFTIMHYPNGAAADSKLSTSAQAVEGSKTVKLKINDSYLGSGACINNIDASKIVIKDSNDNKVDVYGITPSGATGEFDITLKNQIASGEYTLTLPSDLSDSIGRTLTQPNVALNVETVRIFYRDYEDYTGGADIVNATGKYGTLAGTVTGTWTSNIKPVTGKNGGGVCFNDASITKASGAWKFRFDKEYTDGMLYVAFDIKATRTPKNNTLAAKETFIKLADNTMNDTDWTTGLHGFVGIGDKKTSNVSDNTNHLYGAVKNSGWNANDTGYALNEETHKIEVLFDIKNAVYKYYVDGQFVKEFTTAYFGVSGCVIQMSNIIDYFDTFTIMHYPNGVVNDSNIIAVSAIDDADDKKIKVNFRDSAMGFGTVMPNFDKDKVTVKAKNGSPINVSGVTSGEKTGEYIIELETTPSNGEYIIEFANDLTDTVGRTLVNLTDSSFLTATVVKDGNTAAVKYNSAKEYTGLVLWAAYSDGILVATNVQPINTAEGNNLSVSVPNEYTNVTYKIYIWNDCMQPVGSYNN